MTTPHDDDAFLEAVLKTTEPYRDDDGFTARVVTALPRRRRQGARARVLVLLTSTALAVLAGLLVPPVRELLLATVQDATDPFRVLTLPLASVVLVAVALWGAFAVVTAEE